MWLSDCKEAAVNSFQAWWRWADSLCLSSFRCSGTERGSGCFRPSSRSDVFRSESLQPQDVLLAAVLSHSSSLLPPQSWASCCLCCTATSTAAKWSSPSSRSSAASRRPRPPLPRPRVPLSCPVLRARQKTSPPGETQLTCEPPQSSVRSVWNFLNSSDHCLVNKRMQHWTWLMPVSQRQSWFNALLFLNIFERWNRLNIH